MVKILKAEKVDKIRKMKIEVTLGTKIRTFLILVDSIKEDNLEKENIEMILDLVTADQTTIEETMMTTKKTILEIKDTAESGLTGEILILILSGKFGSVHWTEKLARAIS
jgi:pyruvate/2-oxoglutarate/acetoin dehydrogenase E1 component